jgi:hypothetical protein
MGGGGECEMEGGGGGGRERERKGDRVFVFNVHQVYHPGYKAHDSKYVVQPVPFPRGEVNVEIAGHAIAEVVPRRKERRRGGRKERWKEGRKQMKGKKEGKKKQY